MRKKDNWVAIYDALERSGFEDPANVWKALSLLNSTLRSKAQVIPYPTQRMSGKKVPLQLVSIQQNDLPLLLEKAEHLRTVIDHSVTATSPKHVKVSAASLPKLKITRATVYPKNFKLGSYEIRNQEELKERLLTLLNFYPANQPLRGTDLRFMFNLLSRLKEAEPLLKDGLLAVKVVPGLRQPEFQLVLPTGEVPFKLKQCLNPSVEPIFTLQYLSVPQFV